MDDQNTSFNLNGNPVDPNQTPQANPLNTGNGLPNMETSPVTQETAPHEIPIATEAAPEPPVETVISSSASTESVNQEVAPARNFKKYIIIAVVVILGITIGLAVYYFYFSNSETTDTDTATSEPDNTLSTEDNSEISPEMEELEEVVEDLKDVYSEQSSDTSAPPSITIDLSERDTPEEVDRVTKENAEKYGLSSPKTEPTPKKIAR